MKVIKHEIKTKSDQVRIIPLGDLHVGDKQFDRKLLNETIEQIKNDPDTYVILLGDLIDNAIHASIGNTYAAEIPGPMDQLEAGVKIFEPIKDRILAVCIGNHEERTVKQVGLDITYLLCKQLRIEDRYTPTSALVWVQIQKPRSRYKTTYSIFCNHGAGGGRKIGGKANRLVHDAGSIIDADIFLVGHTHNVFAARQNYFRVDRVRGVVTEVDRLFVNTNAFLKYEGSYGERQLYQPASRKVPQILLSNANGDRKAEAIL